MTKFETREVQKTLQHGAILGLDYVARSLSSLHRSAMSNKSKREIYDAAIKVRAHLSKEWIV